MTRHQAARHRQTSPTTPPKKGISMTTRTEERRTLAGLAAAARHGHTILSVDPHPSVSGRWQPTRAGAVNSWRWGNEQFAHFAGWLALVGQNGSGKSLTAATLCPTFVDGDISAKGLSASGEAAGTLTAIHTHGHTGPPRTGMWWQEYGITQPAGSDPDASTSWMTAGLWLRSHGGSRASLDRAWFLVPARVDADLVLERDGEPVGIEDLAGQLAAHQGILFTSDSDLERACRRHGHVVRREEEFPAAVRAALYEPLDAAQIEALGSILRALRGVQANDKISPTVMQETLTSALPSLDGSRVQLLADALAKTEELQTKLSAKRAEQRLLSQVRDAYRRYAAAAAVAAATGFLTADRRDSGLKARAQELRKQREGQLREQTDAKQAVHEGEQQQVLVTQTIKSLEGRVQGHPGADLNELGRSVQTHEARAKTSADQAAAAAAEQQLARHESGSHSREADHVVAGLLAVTGEVEDVTMDLQGGAVHQVLAQVTARLAGSPAAEPDPEAEAALSAGRDQASVWVAARRQQMERARAARLDLDQRTENHEEAQERHAAAQERSQAAQELAWERAEEAENAETQARSALEDFTGRLRQLPAPPAHLTGGPDLDPEAIRAWVRRSAEERLAALNLVAVQARARAQESAAEAAGAEAEATRAQCADAGARAEAAAGELTACAVALAAAPEPLDQLASWARAAGGTGPEVAGEPELLAVAGAARGALAARRSALGDAAEHLTLVGRARDLAQGAAETAGAARSDADLATAQAEADTVRAAGDARTWAQAVLAWASSLTVLDRAQLRLPPLTPPQDAVRDLDEDVETAYRRVSEALTADLTTAQHHCETREERLADVEANIARVQRVEPAPAVPAWRSWRQDRAGAPLWQLVSFAPQLSDTETGLLEGALLASGLLDAWVSPDGEVHAGDITLVPVPSGPGTTLADLLVPEPDGSVPAAAVRAVLSGIAVLAPDADPVPGRPAYYQDGRLLLGPLAAAGPQDWQPRHIGAVARERARQAQLAVLREQRDAVAAELAQATAHLDATRARLTTLRGERQLPGADGWLSQERAAASARDTAQQRRETAAQAAAVAQARSREAEQAAAAAAQACSDAHVDGTAAAIAAAQAQCMDLHGQIATVVTATRSARDLAARAHRADDRAKDARADLTRATTAWQTAQRTGQEIEADLAHLPTALDLVEPAREAAKRSQHDADTSTQLTAQSEAEVAERHTRVRQAREKLHSCARTAHGSLPLQLVDLDRQQGTLDDLSDLISRWSHTASKALFALRSAARLHTAAERADRHARELHERAAGDDTAAKAARHHYDQEKRQYELPYQELLTELESNQVKASELHLELAQARTREQASLVALGITDTTLATHARLAETSESERQARLAAFQCLFDHGLVDHLADSGTLERPESPSDARSVAAVLIEQRGLTLTPSFDQACTEEYEANSVLERNIRISLVALLPMNRQVSSEELPGTRWRHVVVAEYAAGDGTAAHPLRTKPLHTALDDLSLAVTTLESDFNEQVQTEVKGVVFSELRKDINVRINLAEEIVSELSGTLEGVRTGVAQVGVKLEWLPRNEDPDASEALALVRDVNHEGSYDRMYDFFIRRLKHEEKNHLTWAKRVEHVFDYRNWFTWDISLTHKDFAEPAGSGEVFRKVTPRSNPLSKLSAGEKRLATMLPLLAAAHAMYSTPGYTGPRTVYIDELNAALDSKNLRRLLSLLRQWDFDALVTLPAMQPLLVPEAGEVAIHRIHERRDSTRYSLPCRWTGHGTPQAISIRVTPARTHDTTDSSAAHAGQEAH
jgi:Putative exonuclease SbcCD, C subunit